MAKTGIEGAAGRTASSFFVLSFLHGIIFWYGTIIIDRKYSVSTIVCGKKV
jgi:hypothetical protein